jgi:hypothetical protein
MRDRLSRGALRLRIVKQAPTKNRTISRHRCRKGCSPNSFYLHRFRAHREGLVKIRIDMIGEIPIRSSVTNRSQELNIRSLMFARFSRQRA